MRNWIVALTLAGALAGFGASPALAAKFRFGNPILEGSVSLACALDYSNSNETRMIVTNSSGATLAKGRKLSWTAPGGGTQGAFYLRRDFPAGQVLSFGLNAKGYDCTVIVARPEYLLLQ